MNVQLNPRQELYLSKYLKGLNRNYIDKASPIYWDYVLNILNKEYFEPEQIQSFGARDMIFSIIQRIQLSFMSEEIESILAEVEAIPDDELPENETTKVQSMKKSKKNSSKGHVLIRSALQSTTEPLSRTELANLTNLRLSSICARVVELIEEGTIKVAGIKHDKESDRMVETLELV